MQVKGPDRLLTIEPLLLGLDAGELQVLLLARDLQPDWVLVDERLGRRVARVLQLPVKGTVGILLPPFMLHCSAKQKLWRRYGSCVNRVSASVQQAEPAKFEAEYSPEELGRVCKLCFGLYIS